MATRRRVQCINKTDREDPHERISHIGGQNADGTRWRIPEDTAIREIKADNYEFYVLVDDVEVDVIIAEHEDREYLKTENDSIQPDNLLALSECPD